MASEQDLLDRAVARMLRSMVATAGAGAVLLFAWKGWTWSAGFVLGAAVSWFNFRWLKQLVDALGGKRPRTRLAVILGCRYLLLGAGAYVIVSFSSVSLPAALVGLFVSVAAVIIEILFQLVYARV